MALYSYGLCIYARPGAAEEDERRVVEVGQHVDRAALAAQRDLAEQAFFSKKLGGTPTGDRPRMHVDVGMSVGGAFHPFSTIPSDPI